MDSWVSNGSVLGSPQGRAGLGKSTPHFGTSSDCHWRILRGGANDPKKVPKELDRSRRVVRDVMPNKTGDPPSYQLKRHVETSQRRTRRPELPNTTRDDLAESAVRNGRL